VTFAVFFQKKNDKHVFLVVVMLYIYLLTFDTLCRVDCSTTAAIANRDSSFSYYINYKFLEGKGKIWNCII